ncbi:MAG TPA: hypothetical protein VG222_02055 [Vicinamibacterales bacterium]|nr:hypothetical protein [Vicinamibacterales bacterium]
MRNISKSASWQWGSSLDSLQIKWCEFTALFLADAIDLLNQSASTFFYLVKQMMFNDAMLHLSRLTDPGVQNGFENLSIRRLSDLISDVGLKQQVVPAVAAAVTATAFARSWRDKRLAHSDTLSIQGQATVAQPDVEARNVATGIESVRAVVSLVAAHYQVFSLSGSSPRPNPWGSQALLYALQRATIVGHDKRTR